jgi:two-component system CheB/CheR fusion protein
MPDSPRRQTKTTKPRLSRRSLLARGPPDESVDFPVIGIGASAGGLDACTKLISALPADNGLAFILVQHLDPTHESLMVALLAAHTTMTVSQATEGMPIEREHVYVIPPGTYLSVDHGLLHLSSPTAPHGARLPFDFLLNSLAESYGPRAVCLILSGTGADGSLGLKAIKKKRGLVIAQDPDEAEYEGMPKNAIATGAVDLVLPVAEIPDALNAYKQRQTRVAANRESLLPEKTTDFLPEIVDLLRTQTPHDFTLYKPGTLERRIERRMSMAAIETDGMGGYFKILQNDPTELELLAKDLLINVTSFFRDPKVFDFLAEKIIPDLVRNREPNQPLRLWIAGCSTGEETYSLTMLILEEITAAKSNIKLQVFASDVDADAVSSAREGIYPETIEADVSPARLARFFKKEDRTYRASPELRGSVVFTVQDVLADPPFSRLDMVSCRNLLIYLRPEAQAKVVSIFHFALREGGILLLGNAETVGNLDARFAVISKTERLYRHIGRSRPGEFGFVLGDGMRVPARPGQSPAPPRQLALAELCRRLVIENHAPAAVLINRKHECLFSLGPTDRYLRIAPGNPSHDLLAMARDGIRTKLRAAIEQAAQQNTRTIVDGGRINHDGAKCPFAIDIQPVLSDGEPLLLVCFVDAPKQEQKQGHKIAPSDVLQVSELEHELETTKTELRTAIRSLEMSSEEQTAINEEALSVNEEFQSTNEELLTSKEELQSLNEELSALNSQLQETLERQRTTSNDLQNILYSTDVATLFLDTDLRIRFFTPATRSLFAVIPGDIGRPLADLNSLAADSDLLTDARSILQTKASLDREIEGQNGIWYARRIMPYHTDDNRVEGVVITFSDVTERKQTAKALEAARQEADSANVAKSRFLAAASHDLRQPLQTMSLLQGLLARKVEGEPAQKLVVLLEETLGAMSGMLNTLLDINQIDAGTVHAEIIDFSINDKLIRLRDEFSYHAQAKGLSLHVVPCNAVIRSDRRLLEQMIRNLISNAMKYTIHGKVLLGCRQRAGMLSIEVWDTGIGIPDSEFQAIFEEYYQIGNAARERSRGLGLGLSIVQRLGNLLDHRVHVRSHAGKGSVFSIDVPLTPAGIALPPAGQADPKEERPATEPDRRTGAILVIDDDPEIRSLLELALKDEGHHVETVADGPAALELVARGTINPDLILADYNLPNDMNGVQLAVTIQKTIHRKVPTIVLTGDISTAALRDIAGQGCLQMTKPVNLEELTRAIRRLLPISRVAAQPSTVLDATDEQKPVVFVVDDDRHVRAAICALLEDDGRVVEEYSTCEAFLEAYRPGREACLLIDAYLPGMTGLELLQRLHDAGDRLPAIMITGNSDVTMAVEAMKSGASDFVEKPVTGPKLLAGIDTALEHARDSHKRVAQQETAAAHLSGLTSRQRQIMDLVLAGHPSKNIAADLGISQRTVENHRASIMKRTGSKSLPALARVALAAVWNEGTIEN